MVRSIFFVLIVVLVIYYFSIKSPEIKQPLNFNHKSHTDLLIECIACHRNAENQREAGIPNIETCSLCHNPENIPLWNITSHSLKGYITEKRQIPWERVYIVKDHTLFSHRRHTGIARIDCRVCHGAVTEMTESVIRPFIEFSKQRGMNNCVDCHKKEKVVTDCLMCHR